MTNDEGSSRNTSDFFNAGQKLYFWAIVVSAVVVPHHRAFRCGSRTTFGRLAVGVSYVLHDIAALVMLAGFIVHIYEGTAAAAGHVPGR